ncbi:hypothetical protein LRR18_18380, partial [Mangrovimonas sp. AS39]|uniref:hypothetical protein n=1 Tax=Mangrovimonas futianensis TaxID=2895523 RepID=UPI001E51D609
MSYKEGILNAEIAGGILVVAGIIGIMHCFHLVKNAKVAAYVMEFAIAYRIVTFIVSFIIGPYEPPKVTNILVWSLLLFSA